MNANELRSGIKEYCRRHNISIPQFAKRADVNYYVVNSFMNGKNCRNDNFEKMRMALAKDSSKKEVVIDLNNLASIMDGLEAIDDFKNTIETQIQAYEDKLSKLYKLQEMLSKK